MTTSPVPASKLPGLTTAELIGQYDLAAYGAHRGGMPNWKMRRARIARITDLLLVRAEDGDVEADIWFQEA